MCVRIFIICISSVLFTSYIIICIVYMCRIRISLLSSLCSTISVFVLCVLFLVLVVLVIVISVCMFNQYSSTSIYICIIE